MSEDIENEEMEEKAPDLGQAEQALFFGEAVIGGPAWFQEAAQSRANFAQRLPGTSEWTIGNGVGSLGQLTREEVAQKQKEETAEWFEQWSETVEQAREQEREREEWAQAKHKYAGIEMTGEEWGEFADQLKGDTPLRKFLLEKLRKEGKTDAKASEMVDQMALLARMRNLPPSQWTDDMKALDARLDANPALKAELQADMRAGDKFRADFKTAGQSVEQNRETSATNTVVSTDAGADILAQDAGSPSIKSKSFATTISGPAIAATVDLGEHYKAANAASEPLDNPKQIASITPSAGPVTPSPGGGFDV